VRLVAVVASGVLAATTAGCSSSPDRGGASVTTRVTAPASTSAALPPDVGPEAWAGARARAVQALAERRAAAATRGDRAAWLADLEPGDPRLRAAQTAVLSRMVAMRAGDVAVAAVRERSAPVPAPRGTKVDWDVRVTSTYRLQGFDTAPRTFDLDLTVRADPADPAGVTVVATLPADRPQPWDLAGLVVRRTDRALVLGVGSATRMAEVQRRAVAAGARVAAVWGRSRPAVWVAPATDADAARLLGRQVSDLEGVAAATDGPLVAGSPAGADRIVVVPGPWDSLRPAGRDVVMTHELTHATVRSSTTRPVPLWLSEGFAELVGYRAVDLPEATAVAPALDAVRADGLPQSLPADTAFDPSTGRLPVAYGQSLLVLRTLADRYGTAGVVRFYRAAAGGLAVPTDLVGDPEAVADRALRAELRTDRAALVRAWQARLRALLRQG
jgi:hypothetical protein